MNFFILGEIRRVGRVQPRHLAVFPFSVLRAAQQGLLNKTPKGETQMSVNRTDLVAAIAAKSGLNKTQSDAALKALEEVLVDSLKKGDAVKVTGLLSVERVSRAARTGRNPRTGEEIKIPAGFGVKISAGSNLKEAVQK